jgi:[NiFe] hydrogenase diaphorase moiety large subunit
MSNNLQNDVKEICQQCSNDRARMMDIVRCIQLKHGCVSSEALDLIATELSVPRVEVESAVTFYSFLSKKPKGDVVIRLCDDIIDKQQGVDRIEETFKEELGIGFGETTPDGKITLEHTPCIGMCDQAPAAMVNDTIVTYLSTDSAKSIVKTIKETGDPSKLVHRLGDGNNALPLIKSMVHNNIRKKGEVIFADIADQNAGLKKAINMSPVEVIRDIKAARLRGRGGAGFPTGMKWDFTRGADGAEKYILCNADEGEPGTFKDRALLTERADLAFSGMTIAGYAIGAEHGIMYLRGEYAYLKNYLEDLLAKRRALGLLGENICDKDGFNFDIRIQMGAGAYVCGEETSLISSCEGLRGDPKTRPPFPAQKGYLGKPTTVNNVETFCCVARIVENGAAWFSGLGSKGSAGTKLLSICGDCSAPGIYEYPFGTKISQILEDVGASDTMAIQVGGPSGKMIGKDFFEKTICYDDMATGGSFMIFDKSRKILEIVDYFMEFFVDESCGYCTPCRVGNVLIKKCLENIMAGKGEPADLDYLEDLGKTVKTASRCGLGQTSPNPVLTTIANFREVYEKLLKKDDKGMQPAFDISAALQDAEAITNRKSEIY